MKNKDILIRLSLWVQNFGELPKGATHILGFGSVCYNDIIKKTICGRYYRWSNGKWESWPREEAKNWSMNHITTQHRKIVKEI